VTASKTGLGFERLQINSSKYFPDAVRKTCPRGNHSFVTSLAEKWMPRSLEVEPLGHQAVRTDGRSSLENIVESHGRMVDSMARRIRASIPDFACIELKDLIQAGNVGLVNAVNSYSSETGVPFELYARFRIRGEMLDTLRRLDAASRTLRCWQRKIRRTALDLSFHLKREPTEEEISNRLGLELDRLRKKNLDIRTASAVTRSAQRVDNMDEASQEQPDPSESRPDSLQSDSERRRIVMFAVNQLPDRPRQIILMYYQQEYTMRQIGEILQLDESRISQIHKGALRLIAENLRMSGIRSATDL
jgi:RNA polymerase sigma factor for flagellar operon FliA